MQRDPWLFHHLALGYRKGRGDRISSLQGVVRDVTREDWNVRMQRGVQMWWTCTRMSP